MLCELLYLLSMLLLSNPCIVKIVQNYSYYRIAGKFGGELNLAVLRSSLRPAKLNSANISYLHICVWRSLTEPPNLNPPIFLHWRFRAQPPNLIPANISGYTVGRFYRKKITTRMIMHGGHFPVTTMMNSVNIQNNYKIIQE